MRSYPNPTRRGPILLAGLAALLTVGLVSPAASSAAPRPTAAAADQLGMPRWSGSSDPIPAEPAGYRPAGTLQAFFDKEKNGTSFWMDRLLTRRGADPAGDWLMTRGRGVFMKVHDPKVIGFGGQVAYWESIDNRSAYSITFGEHTLTEDVSKRVQTPSYWRGTYTDGKDLTVVVTKFITAQNVAVTELAVTNHGTVEQQVPVSTTSPYTTTVSGDELIGTMPAKNNITLVYPRLSGDGMHMTDGALTTSLRVRPGKTAITKVQMGFLTREIPASATEYAAYRAAGVSAALHTHVRDYNEWWAKNIPYLDVPDPNIKKQLYYRYWLMRFNYLDIDAPGQAYQMPTSVEGALGYNNAIDLTLPMFIDDLKYVREPAYSYGPWVQAGEVAENGRFRDNPGDPDNWSTSHSQYIAEAAWQSYLVHGGSKQIVRNYAQYAAGEVRGELAYFDKNNNGVLEVDGTAWTGNDADAVSYFKRPGATLERPESADVYSGAVSAAAAYRLLGDSANAKSMQDIATKVKNGIVKNLWDPKTKMIESRFVDTGELNTWKEANNYEPFTVGLMPNTATYKEAFRLIGDPNHFPLFPFYTADQSDKAAAAAAGQPGSNNFASINSTRSFRLLATALRHYPSKYLTNDMFGKLIAWNAWSQFVDGDNRWPDSNEFWADYNDQTQQIEYRSWIHHTILGSSNWTIIEDVAGLQPRTDGKIELWPIDVGYDHFAVNNVNYHGRNLDIVWDSPAAKADHYTGVPKGLSVYLDGVRVYNAATLSHVVIDPAAAGERVPSVAQVDLSATRVPDMMQKAGRDLSATTGKAVDLAQGATASASFADASSSVAGAVDGYTILAPRWGSKGSPSATDWYRVDLPAEHRVNDVKLYFYEDRQPGGYATPAMYTVQYLSDGTWKDVAQQRKVPSAPQANYNHVTFPAITTSALRVVMTRQPGHATGLTEVQAFSTDVGSALVRNYAPQVSAWSSAVAPGSVKLAGQVLDDALPSGVLTSRWTTVSGPGTVIFDDASAPSTTMRVTEGGTYVVRLSATDGSATGSSTVTVSVPKQSGAVNVAPDATASASYTSPWEHVAAVNDGIDPTASNDTTNPRWGTWPQQGTQWVQLDWTRPVHVDGSDLYFLDDGGGVLVPKSWSVQYWNEATGAWSDVSGATAYGLDKDAYNHVSFDAVVTTKLRVTLVANGAAVGIDEWKADAVAAQSVRAVQLPTSAKVVPTLPATVLQTDTDGTVLPHAVTWPQIEPEQVAAGGTSFTVTGIVQGSNLPAIATVWVRVTDAVSIVSLADEAVQTKAGRAPALPPTVTATYNDGSKDNVHPTVTWAAVDPAAYAAPGTFTVTGTVAGTSLPAKAIVTVT